jgi:DNA-binding MarR family transcriptional regulator
MKHFVDDLVALCRYFGMFEREHVCCGTVTVQQCVVLQGLLGGPSEVGPLADAVGSSPSAMTRLIDGLVSHGWAERVRAADDRRCVHVHLTAQGLKEARRLRGLTEQSVDLVLGAIPKNKRAQVVESVGLVRQAMEDTREAVQNCCG